MPSNIIEHNRMSSKVGAPWIVHSSVRDRGGAFPPPDFDSCSFDLYIRGTDKMFKQKEEREEKSFLNLTDIARCSENKTDQQLVLGSL